MTSSFCSGERAGDHHVEPESHPTANLVDVMDYLIGGNGQLCLRPWVPPEVL